MKYLKTKNGKLAYLDEGAGPVVLLIHGLAGDHLAWSPQISAWKERFRVIAPDTRGAGLSDQVDEPVTLESLADDFVELIEHLNVEKVNLVGRSMGGCIAQWIALKLPGRVASIAFVASCGKFDPLAIRCLENMREVLEWTKSWEAHARHSVRNFVAPSFFNSKHAQVGQIEALIGSSTRMQACYLHQSRAVTKHDLLERLHEIACPTFVMSGSVDPLGGPLSTQWLVDRLTNVRRYEFADCSHFFLMEQPRLFMEKMDEWWAEVLS